jgi:hypothetical protein
MSSTSDEKAKEEKLHSGDDVLRRMLKTPPKPHKAQKEKPKNKGRPKPPPAGHEK